MAASSLVRRSAPRATLTPQPALTEDRLRTQMETLVEMETDTDYDSPLADDEDSAAEPAMPPPPHNTTEDADRPDLIGDEDEDDVPEPRSAVQSAFTPDDLDARLARVEADPGRRGRGSCHRRARSRKHNVSLQIDQAAVAEFKHLQGLRQTSNPLSASSWSSTKKDCEDYAFRSDSVDVPEDPPFAEVRRRIARLTDRAGRHGGARGGARQLPPQGRRPSDVLGARALRRDDPIRRPSLRRTEPRHSRRDGLAHVAWRSSVGTVPSIRARRLIAPFASVPPRLVSRTLAPSP